MKLEKSGTDFKIAVDPEKGAPSWGGARKGAGRKPGFVQKGRISVRLDPALIEKMDALSENRSAIVEKAVRRYLSEDRGQAVAKRPEVFPDRRFLGDAMIDLILQMEPAARSSVPVDIPKLWQKAESAGWNRRDFEETLFDLAKNYRISLHRHVHVLQASKALKKAALRGKDGSLYIGIVMESGDPDSAEW